MPKYIKQYFNIVQELYIMGFVTIMWEENKLDIGSKSFEIVFRRFYHKDLDCSK